MVKDLTSSFNIPSIYGVFIEIWWILMVNVSKYIYISSMNPMGSLIAGSHHIRLTALQLTSFFNPHALQFEARPGAKSPESLYREVWVPSAIQVTPWKFNSSPLKIYHPKRKGSSSNHHFSGAMLNFWGVNQRKQRKFGDWRIIPLGG